MQQSQIEKDLMRNTYQMHVGSKIVTFQLTDPIFALEQPAKVARIPSNQETVPCIVCDKELKRAHKHICEFCGHRACEKCAYKLRVFANQFASIQQMENLALSDLQRQCRMGRCCRVCDRKFFLRASFQSHAAQIGHY